MFDLKLFLGFPTNSLFIHLLQQTNPYLVSLFIGKEEYLQEIHYEDKKFLGKHLGMTPTLDQLEDSEKHILSLLKQVVPQYSFSQNALQLLILNHG